MRSDLFVYLLSNRRDISYAQNSEQTSEKKTNKNKIQHYLTIENDFYNFLNFEYLLLNCGTYKRFVHTKAGFQRKIVYVKIKEKQSFLFV